MSSNDDVSGVSPAPVVSGLAVASLVCGILGFLTIGTTGLLGVIFGHVSLARIKRAPNVMGGRGLAIAGLVVGYVSMIVAIFMFLAAGAIAAMRGVGDQAKLQQAKSDCATLANSLSMYKLNAGTYPTAQQGLRALVEKPVSNPVPRRWTRISAKVPLDPWGNEYRYRYPGGDVPEEPEIFSVGPDGVEGTSDDVGRQGR